jgi:hypothetical protein
LTLKIAYTLWIYIDDFKNSSKVKTNLED